MFICRIKSLLHIQIVLDPKFKFFKYKEHWNIQSVFDTIFFRVKESIFNWDVVHLPDPPVSQSHLLTSLLCQHHLKDLRSTIFPQFWSNSYLFLENGGGGYRKSNTLLYKNIPYTGYICMHLYSIFIRSNNII